MKIALAGAGAFGIKHLDGIRNISGVEVASIVGRRLPPTGEVAKKYAIEHATTELQEALANPEIEAVILCTPTQMHAEQAIECMRAGKHVQIEIPLADSWQDAQAVARVQRETGKVCMAGHTRRFNPSHQWIHKSINKGTLSLQHLVVETYFFRRSNINALGQSRSWKDNLLWHHAAHTVDLFQHQTGEKVVAANAMYGPKHPELEMAMDMSIQMKSESGKLCTLSLSFNNDGPLGTSFRYICDKGTFIARYDELLNGAGDAVDVSSVDVSMNGIELQDREFFAAISENRQPRSSVSEVLSCYEVLHQLEQTLVNKSGAN